MRKLLLTNLARNQSFDAALRAGQSIDAIAAEYLDAILFQTNETKRVAALAELQADLVKNFANVIQPAARQIGVENAKAVLAATPEADMPTAAYRKRILYEGKAEAADRVRIVQALVNDKANTLENRLTAFYLEPGLQAKEKLATLKALHERDDVAQSKYNSDLAKQLKGDGPKPRKPQVDFMARLQNEVKQDVRTQARRAGTAAETQTFQSAGHDLLAWVTVNASEACPDCRRRQGVTGDAAFWNANGRPGSGNTICGANCFCMLVPAGTLDSNADLKQNGLEVNVKRVATTAAADKRIQAAGDDEPVTVIAARDGPAGEAIPRRK